jgi:ankyrin repeat protein
MFAAAFGHVQLVRVLLEGGAGVERTSDYQQTALHLAAFYGHLDVVRLLLDWGAKVDPLDKDNYTSLHYAAMTGHLSVLKLLVDGGADVTLKNGRGQTASELSRSLGRHHFVDWLDSVSGG